MKLSTSGHALAVSASVILLVTSGCSEATAPSQQASGVAAIAVSTGGETIDFDPDGYTLSVDSGTASTISTSGTFTIPNLARGRHLIRLDGLAPNCSVAGANPQPVDIAATSRKPAAVPVTFAVTCAPNFGSIRASAATLGEEFDDTGYSLTLPNARTETLPTNGALTITNVRVGQVPLKLSSPPTNCDLDGSAARTAKVEFNQTTDVAFALRCVATGSILIKTSTNGPDGDSNYEFRVGRSASSMTTSVIAPATGSMTLNKLRPGSYVISSPKLSNNCESDLPNSHSVEVRAGSATRVSLNVTCEATSQILFWDNARDVLQLVDVRSAQVSAIPQERGNQQSAWSFDGKRIAFTGYRGGTDNIYTMAADGGDPRRVTQSASEDINPTWSPTGTRIAFASGRDLNVDVYSIGVDGTNLLRLTTDSATDGSPAWSPDGTTIAFFSQREGSNGIWLMNADGSNQRRLTNNGGEVDIWPAWSSDGKKIVFARNEGEAAGTNLFLIDSDGSNLTRLTSGRNEATHPTWSPSGQQVAFADNVCTGEDDSLTCNYAVMTIWVNKPADEPRFLVNGFVPAWRPRH